jgi:hypothetical protein
LDRNRFSETFGDFGKMGLEGGGFFFLGDEDDEVEEVEDPGRSEGRGERGEGRGRRGEKGEGRGRERGGERGYLSFQSTAIEERKTSLRGRRKVKAPSGFEREPRLVGPAPWVSWTWEEQTWTWMAEGMAGKDRAGRRPTDPERRVRGGGRRERKGEEGEEGDGSEGRRGRGGRGRGERKREKKGREKGKEGEEEEEEGEGEGRRGLRGRVYIPGSTSTLSSLISVPMASLGTPVGWTRREQRPSERSTRVCRNVVDTCLTASYLKRKK